MKTYHIFIFLCFSLLSCSSDDTEINDVLIGEWELKQQIIFSFQGEFIQDYSENAVRYKFNPTGILEITSSIPEFESRTVNYDVLEECLSSSCSNGELPTDILRIENTRNTFNLSNGTLRFGTSYVDGPDFVLERIP